MNKIRNCRRHLFSPGRRTFITGVAASTALLGLPAGLKARTPRVGSALETLRGNRFDLHIGYQPVNFTGRKRTAVTVNGSLPGPVLRWREGDTVTLNVTNHLAHDTSIHWHGVILPSHMDGVPGLSFSGIKPGETFSYQFQVSQSGTYWYHSHSDFQEQQGLYGSIVIDPAEPDPVAYDRDYVVLLSDWSDETPHNIYSKLKKEGHYYNLRRRTAGDLWREIRDKGLAATWREREMWNLMRMSDRDISDVTGRTYTYLMNGQTPDDNWTALFKRGEKIRLRFINAAAMSIFDIRIPGLKMKVVASDGQNIEPVTVDEFRIGVAETYDVVVEPEADTAYTLFAQTIDRSGFARGTLTSDLSLTAPVPAMDYAPVLTHRDMGMAHGSSDMNHTQHPMNGMDHARHGMEHNRHQMGGTDHTGHTAASGYSLHGDRPELSGMQGVWYTGNLGRAGFGSHSPVVHLPSEYRYTVDMRSEHPMNGLRDPGVGLRDHMQRYGRRVLNYGDIRNLTPTIDKREPSRELQLHLTGNMERYLWGMDGIPFNESAPLMLNYGERIRITLVNDTMMTHPIHLHGMWSELETEEPDYIPRKHTVLVQPGSQISYLVTANAYGRWAYHCHLLYHMPGMFREVRVV
ncbi:copper resistance system multicopper oxidase [Microbulbifer thermotolerans]|uniref:copper resistance system multicopper oxidase n=1 Tax=Microbulbifer thermotolerans TaxID=252514 RepID=UPI00224B9DF2|nr:copper resistance system multicopper oxidase [Microbulbifer thermotolerans]MCX2780798.1 copper resistance system multicopper oxidase [Microbulbifer thermotolerans]MCX2804763.1 copper resistance system multicopper oxidase [Microbulbifer thermotolerans]